MEFLDARDTEVGPSSCKISSSPGKLIARSVTSELLLVLYSAEKKLGMMVRFEDQPAQITFAQSAIRLLLSELPSLGLTETGLTVHAIGGLSSESICFRNFQHFLHTENLSLAGTDLGDSQQRSVWLSLDSGRLVVRTSSRTTAPLPSIAARLAS